jgi:HTH-type transcriptional regulator/antitoxin HigA
MTRYAEILPPGEFLKDELEARSWSQVEFAEIIGRPARLVNEIIAGKRAITPETAVQLSDSLGTSAELWLNLESQYQLSKVTRTDNLIQRKAKLYERFPVRELIRRGWIEGPTKLEQLEQKIMDFFCIESIDEKPVLAHAARKTSYADEVSILQYAWLCRVKQIAESHVARKYDRSALIKSFTRLRNLLGAPEEARNVAKILGECGVRFVLVEALPRSKIDGACLWLENSQPVVALSARLDRIDNFWFVLRHELEHLIQEHGKESGLMLDEDLSESASEAEEAVANKAASEFAVEEGELTNYMARVNPYFFSEDRVLGFAGRIGVHPGIVIGRLQKRLEQTDYPNPYKFLRAYLVKIRHIAAQTTPTDGWGQIYPLK